MYNLTDHFCGAGGSTAGAIQVPGVVCKTAANHWDRAVETHAENHPETDHILADLNVINPAYFPYTELAWFSPSCPGHSPARGVEADHAADDLWGESLPEDAAARSRATMWDVVRFTEYHRYEAIIVENVIDVAKWGPKASPGLIYGNWITSMCRLGYRVEIVCVNSMHSQATGDPAPQSRDRWYAVFTKVGNPAPDLSGLRRPGAMCTSCDLIVASVQSWKREGNTIGRYRQQYVYRCPNCASVVEPYWVPASSIIDWSLLGQRIGDRAKPLATKTRARIAAGIARYWGPLTLEAAGATYDSTDPKHRNFGDPNGYVRAWPTTEPLKTVHTTLSKALAVPVEGREGKAAKPVSEALRTQTARNETGLAFVTHLKGSADSQIRGSHSPVSDPLHTVAASGNHHGLVTPAGGTWSEDSKPTSDPMRTLTTRDAYGLVTPYYGTSDSAKPTTDPIGTITTKDRYALLMRNNTARGDQGQMTTPVSEPIRTITTAGHQSLLTAEDIKVAAEYVDEVLFRMLEPSECKRAMAFEESYVMLGTRREQVRLAGNAVCPPTARDIVAAVVESLEGAA